jgi:serine/threonine protein kinase
MAPEIVAKKEYNGAAADVWSAGVVMYTMLTGSLPFKSTDEKGLYRKIQAG